MLSTSKTRNSLDLTGEDFRAMMDEIIPHLSAFLDNLPKAGIPFPSGASKFLSENAAVVLQPPAEEGRPLRDLLDVIVQAAENDLNAASGGAMAFIPGSGLASSAAAELIAAVFNRYTAFSVVSPAMVALEAEVLRWLATLMGFPEQSGGLLTSGASMAVFSAVVCARKEKLPANFLNGVAYTTDQTHHCLDKAMRLAGFPTSALQLIPSDDRLRMKTKDLRAMIKEDRATGRVPFCIAANAGTTNTGAIDPLNELADVAQEEKLWLHVDAAYGGFFQLTERGRIRLAGIERANSIVLDFHKGLFLPFGTGCLLVRDREVLPLAHSAGDAYLRDLDKRDATEVYLPDFAKIGPELTRPNRGLHVWLPLHLHGVAAFREALDEKLDLAQSAYQALQAMSQIRVFAAPDLSILAFHCRIENFKHEEEDIATEELVKYVNRTGRVRLSTTRIQGRIIARIAILNVRTTAAILEDTLKTIRMYLEEKIPAMHH
jgi:aromatic-L-amino-acid/L-tryptophan decarboxylase